MTLNPKRSKKFRSHLRSNMPEAEVILWKHLKNRQLLGYKIRRQYGVGPYVDDFYCPQLKLGIEVDGDSHFTKKGKLHDEERFQFIRDAGIELLRVTNSDVKENIEGTLEFLFDEFKKRKPRW